MTNKQILKSIKALARGECANYDRGNCLLTDKRCHLVNPNYETCRHFPTIPRIICFPRWKS